jgi:hypothetical protein
MCVSSNGYWPLRYFSFAVRFCLFCPIVLLAACASEQGVHHVNGPTTDRLAAAQAPKVEMEDDGEPAQPPPVRRMRPEEDDPSQPWSRNYGGAPTATPPVSPSQRLPIQQDAITRTRPATTAEGEVWRNDQTGSLGRLTQLSPSEADTIVALAINAQEMRRQ